MILRITIYCCLLISVQCSRPSKEHQCLTGYMTQVQSWVSAKGVLIKTEDEDRHHAIDLSSRSNPVPDLQQKMTFIRRGDTYVKYLSLARCKLTAVPMVFNLRDSKGKLLADTLEFITFYGNEFSEISSPGELYDVSINATGRREWPISAPFQRQDSVVTWSIGFKETEFPRLKELDLRACSIQIIDDNIFKGMSNLEALYIGENEVINIDANAFTGLNNLVHLDFSRNMPKDVDNLQIETTEVFDSLKNLSSLDLSFTKLSQRHMSILQNLGPKLTKLSLCVTGLTSLDDKIFHKTSLKILDLSGNFGILSKPRALSGLENKLQILYARDIGLRSFDVFERFGLLEVLDLSINELAQMPPHIAATLKNLQILDLDKNRLTSWFSPTFSLLPSLKLLSLRDNIINLISEGMLTDIADVQYIAMSGNFIVCNCQARDFFDTALQNEQYQDHDRIYGIYDRENTEARIIRYHRGFIDYNKEITRRKEVYINCTEEICNDFNEELTGNFLILDYQPSFYTCLMVAESKPTNFSDVDGCNRNSRDIDYDEVMQGNVNKLYILLTLPGLLIILIFVYIYRRNFRYCLITMRNSAMLSLVHKDEFVTDSTIFHYDVFVSYCNDDRSWVLDHLLPHLETECSISACLHERDFQVGHSILENIVSCMDRSRSIMLIISQKFLLSQWCQFEMHLAQHRLLETRREDLTLILIEDIPRRLRPNTLHYLMLTKTYIVWPKEDNERTVFWRRIKKTLVSMKLRESSVEGVSFA